jgi:hypothetical protein
VTIDSKEDAHRAVDRAKADHAKAVEQSGEIAVLSVRIRSHQDQNHFADLIRSAFQDGGAER